MHKRNPRRSVTLVFLLCAGLGAALAVENKDTLALPEPTSSGKIWTFPLPQLDAGEESVRSLTERSGSEYILVNFWASWCIPCRREMPMLQEFADSRGEDGYLVVGIAIDDEQKARPVVDKLEITYPILLADFDGVELMNGGGNEMGLLPYTVLLNDRGEILEKKLGEIHKEDLQAWSTR